MKMKERLYGVTDERSFEAQAYGSIIKVHAGTTPPQGWSGADYNNYDWQAGHREATAKAALSTRGSAMSAGPPHTFSNYRA